MPLPKVENNAKLASDYVNACCEGNIDVGW